MAQCKIDINGLPVLTSCPPDTAELLLFNVPNTPNGMALMTVAALKCCWMFQMFGAGIKTVTGAEFVNRIYTNTSLVGDLLVYSWGIANPLILGTQWDYVRNGNGKVIGIEILGTVGFLDDDRFTIFPNATCEGTPAETFTEGINTRHPLSGSINEDFYDLEWTTALRTKYGTFGSFLVYQDDGTGTYRPTGILPVPNDPDNPTIFTFSFNNVDSFIVIS